MVRGGSAAGPLDDEAPPADTLVGRDIGSFRVTGLLGEGGMGRVYLAEHKVIARRAAIKVLSASMIGLEDMVSRFFHEARAVSALSHPNIVDITDFGTFEGQPYIVMEYLQGETLAARLARARRLGEATAVHITAQVASALGAAHERGLVHRDLKPDNIFLCQHADYTDQVKVLDFGIAKLLGSEATKVGHRTQVGALLGTPAYMSPEQCLGDLALDHRSDIYSLGVVIYQMVTGQLPFEGDSLGRLIFGHVHETPKSPASINPSLSPAMDSLVMRAIEKRPEDRFATMRKLREALAPVAPAPAPPLPGEVGPPPRQWLAEAPTQVVAVAPALSVPSSVGNDHTRAEGMRSRLIEIVRSKWTAGSIALPRLSPATERCLTVLADASFSFTTVAGIIGTEPRLASQIVQRANGADFAGLSPATTLERAVGRFGAQGLRVALVEIGARAVLQVRDTRLEQVLRRPFSRGVAMGIIAERLLGLRPVEGTTPSEAHLGALLSDAGRPIVATLLLDIERQLATVRGRRWLNEELLMACVEATHAPVAAELGRSWRLAAGTAQAMEEAAVATVSPIWDLRALLRLAAALASREGHHLHRSDLTAAPDLVEEARRRFGLDHAGLARVVRDIKGKGP